MLKNKSLIIGLIIVAFFVFLGVFAPLISPHDPNFLYDKFLRLPPLWYEQGNRLFLLGTDDLGRDILSRLLYGARISMLVGICVVIISLGVGTFLGLISGYFKGQIDTFIMGLMDILMSFPSILLSILVISILGPGLFNAVIAVAIMGIPGFCRLVRSCILVEKSKDYHLAALSFGASDRRIIFKELLPNIQAPLIVQGTLSFSEAILSVAALGFLGLGARPPLPEWGIMLADARPYIESNPWMVSLPGICIFLSLLGFNLLGDGLRDYFDPKLKRR
jgi:peptide/nickel transport system permease protein/dipeptide transport system permease protein